MSTRCGFPTPQTLYKPLPPPLKYPYPWKGYGFALGKGKGRYENTRGLPVPITILYIVRTCQDCLKIFQVLPQCLVHIIVFLCIFLTLEEEVYNRFCDLLPSPSLAGFTVPGVRLLYAMEIAIERHVACS